MKPETAQDGIQMVEATAVLKALSEPNRLRIFARLMTGDSCNCELRDELGLAPNLLSHHLLRVSSQLLAVQLQPSNAGVPST